MRSSNGPAHVCFLGNICLVVITAGACSSARPPSDAAGGAALTATGGAPVPVAVGETAGVTNASLGGAAPNTAGTSSAGSAAAGDSGGSSAGSSGASGIVGVSGSACALAGSGKTLYVSPQGSASNDGSSPSAELDVASAITAVKAGDTIVLAAGDYVVPYTESQKNTLVFAQQGSAEEPIRVIVAGSGRAKFDFSFPEQAWVQDSFGFFVTGSYWTFCGIDITRAGYQGAYVTGQHNTFENCAFYENRNTGLEINKGGAYTTVIDSDSYRNYDPKKLGGMADGFGPKETQGPGNRFFRCRAWENSDDGYDAYDSSERVTFDGCTAFRNGIDVWGYGGFDGNGNGFKVGGNAKLANHQLTFCAAFANRVKGFDQNNNVGGLTIYNSTAYLNGVNFGLSGALQAGQAHDLRNNVSLGGGSSIANAVPHHNSWDPGFSVAETDFISLDTQLGSARRASNGSLPSSGFLQPTPGGNLIDRGVDVGRPFNGAAPDLGACEAP